MENLMHFRKGSLEDKSWETIYQDQFPPCEQQPIEVLQTGIWFGKIKLHETCTQEGECVCFSLVTDYGDGKFLLLPYIATKKGSTGKGIAQLHLNNLWSHLADDFSDYKGMFVEIEDPHCPGLDDATCNIRQLRLRFYEKGSIKPLPIVYQIPNVDGIGGQSGKLLYIPLAQKQLSQREIAECVARIYVMGYFLMPGNDLFQQVVGSIDKDVLKSYLQMQEEDQLPSWV